MYALYINNISKDGSNLLRFGNPQNLSLRNTPRRAIMTYRHDDVANKGCDG